MSRAEAEKSYLDEDSSIDDERKALAKHLSENAADHMDIVSEDEREDHKDDEQELSV